MSSFVVLSPNVFAKKSNEPIYQDPFDLAAGGASLTRASRDGRMYSNPALMPYGGVFNHWLGSNTSLMLNEGLCELAANPCPLNSSTDTTQNSKEGGKTLELLFKKPMRIGFAQSLSWVTSFAGISYFARTEAELSAKKIGELGTPEIKFESEVYTGLYFATALRSPVRWFSLGVTGKAVVASEPSVKLGLETIDELNGGNPQAYFQDKIMSTLEPKYGLGLDVGSLFFFQGKNIDYLFALKIDDLGQTELKSLPGVSFGGGEKTTAKEGSVGATTVEEVSDTLTSFKQVISAGVGMTVHNGVDQFHFSLDYRDVENKYEEPLFKRVYAGAKFTLRNYIGLAAGVYHGSVSYGAEVDFIFLRLTALTYTREMSKKPGLDPRKVYLISLSSGI